MAKLRMQKPSVLPSKKVANNAKKRQKNGVFGGFWVLPGARGSGAGFRLLTFFAHKKKFGHDTTTGGEMKNGKGKGAGVEASASPQKPGAQQIEQMPVADLIPYARNARTHSEEQVGQIAGSIQEFGFNVPVLIDGQNSIIAGHGRVLAAQRLKLDTVPCIRLTHLTDAQRRAYILADNRIALNSGWDEAMLQVELEELHADDVDLGLLGFEAGELEKLMGFEVGDVDPPELASGDREPFQQMTFTLHDEQVEAIKAAVERAKAAGPFSGPNENSNGNALARIAEAYRG